jgi:hypothetical protein
MSASFFPARPATALIGDPFFTRIRSNRLSMVITLGANTRNFPGQRLSRPSTGTSGAPGTTVPGVGTAQQLRPRVAQPGGGQVPAGGLAQQKRKRGVFDDPIEGVPPHDVRQLMAEQKCNLVPLPLAHFQQRPAHENRPAREGKRIRLLLRRDPETMKGSFFSFAWPPEPARNLDRCASARTSLSRALE